MNADGCGPAPRNSNLGATRLRRRNRSGNPMQACDAFPRPLRQWLSGAVMPWSPASCRSIWQRARAEGEGVETILARLDAAERRMLARDRP